VIRLSRMAWAGLGYAAGWATAATGAGLEWGAGVGLMVGGVATALSLLLLVDIPRPQR
jgi:hypothetical protein